MRRSPSWVQVGLAVAGLAAIVVIVLALAGVFESSKPGLLEGIGQDAGKMFDGGCAVTVRTPYSPVKERWPKASQTALVICGEPNGFPDSALEFAQFPSQSAESSDVAAKPPPHRYCSFGNAMVVVDDDLGDTFDQLCDERSGVLHPR